MVESFLVRLDEEELWRETVSGFDQANVFHTWNWAKTFRQAYGHRPFLVCIGNPGDVRAVLPLSEVSRPLVKPLWVSMPYTDFVSPLQRSSCESELISTAFRMTSADRIQIRPDVPFGDSSCESAYSTYRLNLLSNAEEMLNSLPGKTIRYHINKAIRQGYSIRTATQEDLPAFYRILNLTRKRHGLPTPPRHFYVSLYRNLNMNGNGALLLAERSDGTLAAASWFLWYKQMAIYKYNVNDPVSGFGKANYLLLWNGMRESIRQECVHFDLGRVSDGNTGLVEFKRRWHASRIPLHYMDIDGNGCASPVSVTGHGYGRYANRVISAMPAFFSRLAGSLMYRYFA